MKLAMMTAAAAALVAGPVLAKQPLTRAAAKAHYDFMFQIADTNHDGVLSRAEVETFLTQTDASPAARARTEQMFEALDTAHTGGVTRDQLESEALARFDRTDTNHDGIIEPEEAAAQKAAATAGDAPGMGAPPPR